MATGGGTGQLEDRYVVEEALGHGSFGVVVRARRRSDGHVCACKRVALGPLSGEMRDKALQEAELLHGLDSPHILRYLDSFLEDGELHIITEFCDGGTLLQLIDKQPKNVGLPEDTACRICAQVLSGLAHLHERCVMHRDLKPANIFLLKTGGVVLGDLGIAKVLLKATDQAETFIGSPAYMAPEVVDAQPYGPSSDIWAFGCVAYQMCTTRKPFEAPSAPALYVKILRCKAPSVPGCYSAELRDAICSCLRRIPRKRPGAVDLLHAAPIRSAAQRLGSIVSSPSTPRAVPSLPAGLSLPMPSLKTATNNRGPAQRSTTPIPARRAQSSGAVGARRSKAAVAANNPSPPAMGSSYTPQHVSAPEGQRRPALRRTMSEKGRFRTAAEVASAPKGGKLLSKAPSEAGNAKSQPSAPPDRERRRRVSIAEHGVGVGVESAAGHTKRPVTRHSGRAAQKNGPAPASVPVTRYADRRQRTLPGTVCEPPTVQAGRRKLEADNAGTIEPAEAWLAAEAHESDTNESVDSAESFSNLNELPRCRSDGDILVNNVYDIALDNALEFGDKLAPVALESFGFADSGCGWGDLMSKRRSSAPELSACRPPSEGLAVPLTSRQDQCRDVDNSSSSACGSPSDPCLRPAGISAGREGSSAGGGWEGLVAVNRSATERPVEQAGGRLMSSLGTLLELIAAGDLSPGSPVAAHNASAVLGGPRAAWVSERDRRDLDLLCSRSRLDSCGDTRVSVLSDTDSLALSSTTASSWKTSSMASRPTLGSIESLAARGTSAIRAGPLEANEATRSGVLGSSVESDVSDEEVDMVCAALFGQPCTAEEVHRSCADESKEGRVSVSAIVDKSEAVALPLAARHPRGGSGSSDAGAGRSLGACLGGGGSTPGSSATGTCAAGGDDGSGGAGVALEANVDAAFLAALSGCVRADRFGSSDDTQLEKLGGGRYRYRGHRVFCRLDQEGRLMARRGSEFLPIGEFLDFMTTQSRCAPLE